MFEVAARVRSEVCGGRGGVGWGEEARGGARSGSGGPRESKSHSSSSIHSAHSAAHHTHSHTRLCRSPAGSSQCGRPSWYIRTAKASRRSSRSSGAAPPFGIWHVAKGLGVGAVRRRGGHYGCRCGCGTCSRAARRSPNERTRAPSPNPFGPRPPPSTKRGALWRATTMPGVDHLRTRVLSLEGWQTATRCRRLRLSTGACYFAISSCVLTHGTRQPRDDSLRSEWRLA